MNVRKDQMFLCNSLDVPVLEPEMRGCCLHPLTSNLHTKSFFPQLVHKKVTAEEEEGTSTGQAFLFMQRETLTG